MLTVSIQRERPLKAPLPGPRPTGLERDALAPVYRVAEHLGPGRLGPHPRRVVGPVIDDEHRGQILQYPPDHRRHRAGLVQARNHRHAAARQVHS